MSFTKEHLSHWRAYERVRESGRYNMYDPRARRDTRLSSEQYSFVMDHYVELEAVSRLTKPVARRDHPSITCPACGYTFDCGSTFDDKTKKPYAGAISLCLNCGNLGIFEGDPVTSIREMSKGEFGRMRLEAPREYARMQQAVSLIRARGPIPRLAD